VTLKERIMKIFFDGKWHDPFELRAITLEVHKLKDHLKRLEEAGDKLSDCADQIGWTSCESPLWIKKAENAVKEWRKAKEAKL
jgi:hypothetical protein